mmetsp:Transcript_8090/g.25258  ORF Transcript_8090/g.25258 Transcript_8090/m.25258 type:complete len:439 (-) Transcript_8090:1598-2914(-)
MARFRPCCTPTWPSSLCALCGLGLTTPMGCHPSRAPAPLPTLVKWISVHTWRATQQCRWNWPSRRRSLWRRSWATTRLSCLTPGCRRVECGGLTPESSSSRSSRRWKPSGHTLFWGSLRALRTRSSPLPIARRRVARTLIGAVIRSSSSVFKQRTHRLLPRARRAVGRAKAVHAPVVGAHDLASASRRSAKGPLGARIGVPPTATMLEMRQQRRKGQWVKRMRSPNLCPSPRKSTPVADWAMSWNWMKMMTQHRKQPPPLKRPRRPRRPENLPRRRRPRPKQRRRHLKRSLVMEADARMIRRPPTTRAFPPKAWTEIRTSHQSLQPQKLLQQRRRRPWVATSMTSILVWVTALWTARHYAVRPRRQRRPHVHAPRRSGLPSVCVLLARAAGKCSASARNACSELAVTLLRQRPRSVNMRSKRLLTRRPRWMRRDHARV